MINLKTMSERKRSVQYKWNVVYLDVMFFEVHFLDFCATDVFSGTLIDFFFMMFTLVLIIDLVRMLVISGNYSTVGSLSKCSFQFAS